MPSARKAAQGTESKPPRGSAGRKTAGREGGSVPWCTNCGAGLIGRPPGTALGGSAERRICALAWLPLGHAETRPGQAERTGGEPSGSVEAQAPSKLVLVHDRVGVAVRDAGVVGQPVRAFVAAQERRAGFKAVEPLSEVTSGNDRD